MKHETQHDCLARLGEELLQEFDAAQTPPVPAEFDQKCREMIGRERKKPVRQIIRWTARAAALAFMLVGVLTVATLSIGTLRTPFIRFALAHFDPEQEIRLEKPEENAAEFKLISYAAADNTAMAVYYDGEESYQILWSNEFGQRHYNFRSPGIDEAFFQDLGAQLTAAKE